MHVIDILNSPWAIIPEKLFEIRDIYLRHEWGQKIDLDALEARMGRSLDNTREPYTVVDGVAIIEANGVIAKRMNMFSQISGGTSTQILGNDFETALADPKVHSIVLSMDSPGGNVDGVFELAQEIFAARGKKPIIAYADGMMASAAYAIGSAADKVYMSGPTTNIGSIGVVATHTDVSQAEAKDGIKVTEITAGKYKRLVSQHKPLDQEGRNSIQEKLDYIYSHFVGTVGRNRNATVDAVLEKMAEGRVFIGQQGVDAGLADGLITLPKLITKLNGTRPSTHFAAKGGNMENELSEVQKAAHAAEIAKAEAAAHEKGKAEGKILGIEQGAAAERKRIEDVKANSMPGHEKLIEELMFDGKTSGPEAAVQVLKAHREKLGGKLTEIRGSGSPAVPHAPAPENEQATPSPDSPEAHAQNRDIAERAREYRKAEAEKGVKRTVAECVKHIMSEQNIAKQ